MLIQVTYKHLRNGCQNSPTHCALALAFKDAYPTYDIHVQIKRVQFFQRGKLVYSQRLTNDLAAFVDNYDSGLKTTAFMFHFSQETYDGLPQSNVVDYLRGNRQTL
jgi:hypothetical protein